MEVSPLVSVILPAFNAQAFINESIQSILNQTYRNWELLICDDGSTDKTFDILQKYRNFDPRVRIFRNATNLKLLKTRNRLLEIATGDLITFQDADDYSDAFRFEKMVQEFRRNPHLGLLSSQVGYVDSRGDLIRLSCKPTNYKTVIQQMYTDNVVGGSMMMVKRESLQSVGGKFRSYFDGMSYQDYDLSVLLAERFESYCLPDVLYYYRQHGASNSKIISADRLLAKEIVIHLAHQRRVRGSDDLLDGYPEKVDTQLDLLREPYRKDASLVFRKFAEGFMYSRLYGKAICASWQAVLKGPANRLNWGTLQYCMRMAMFRRSTRLLTGSV